MSTKNERRAMRRDILARLDATPAGLLPAHASRALRHIIKRHGHLTVDARCRACQHEAPCPDLVDALDGVLGVDE